MLLHLNLLLELLILLNGDIITIRPRRHEVRHARRHVDGLGLNLRRLLLHWYLWMRLLRLCERLLWRSRQWLCRLRYRGILH